MKKVFNKIFLTLLVSLLSFTTCIDEDLNTNPDAATNEMMDRDDLRTGSFFSQMLRNVFIVGEGFDGDYQITQNLAGDAYSGYMGPCGLWLSNSHNLTYNPASNWYSKAFNNAYVNVMTPWNEIQKIAKEDFPHKYAIATIVKVESMHRITDTYGPIPYTSFGSGGLNIAYDSQEKVYETFFKELKEAVDILSEFYVKTPNAKVMSENYDYIYKGNVLNWIKFANSLRLRLAVRISYANAAKAKEEAEAAVSHEIGVMTEVSDIATLNTNPMFSYRHPLHVICYEFTDVKMGATMDSYLNGYNDPRLKSYFNIASDGTYRGIRSGINITSKDLYAQGPFSNLNINANIPVVWMNPSEVYFLRAEGTLRGWNMGGSAKDLYEAGIRTSFTYTGSSNYDTYIENNTNVPVAYSDPVASGNNSPALSTITIKWDDDASTELKLERIVTQKWIAMYPDGQEAWSEFRRTTYPRVFPVVVNNSGGRISTSTQIRRLPYPTSEYDDNRENVTSAIGLLGGEDHGGTKLWWDKK